MLLQAIGVFAIVVAAQVVLVARAADMLSDLQMTPRDNRAALTA